MSWIRLDDNFLESPELLGLSDAAIVAYLRLLSYAARHLTDGMVPESVSRSVGPKDRAALASAGLLVDGFLPRFPDHHPSRETVLARRAATRERLERWRSGNAVTNTVGNAAPVPSRPEPAGTSRSRSRGSDFGTEWDDFLEAWRDRGFRFPPSGSADDPKSQRALVYPAVRDFPTLAPEWVRSAAEGSKAYSVVKHVLAMRARWAEENAA